MKTAFLYTVGFVVLGYAFAGLVAVWMWVINGARCS